MQVILATEVEADQHKEVSVIQLKLCHRKTGDGPMLAFLVKLQKGAVRKCGNAITVIKFIMDPIHG